MCGTLRFIGYRTPKDRSIGIRYLREQGDRLLSKAFTKPVRTRYHCRDDAIAAAETAMASVGNMGYRTVVEAVEMEEILKREGPGRPRKDSPPPEVESFWKLKVERVFDETAASELIDGDEIRSSSPTSPVQTRIRRTYVLVPPRTPS